VLSTPATIRGPFRLHDGYSLAPGQAGDDAAHMNSFVPPVLPADVELSDGPDLRLRRHRQADADGIYAQCQDPDMVRFTTVPSPYARSDADQFLAHVAAGWAQGSLAAFAIEVEGTFAGSIDLRLQEGAWAEVGFGLAPWARGRGVMTRALGLLLGWGFAELGLVGVQWQAVVGNEGSRAVANKCGFVMEGTIRGFLVHRGQRLDGWIATVMSTDPRPEQPARSRPTPAH
jgi:RimJ/RimL family protein N-acetyltransferase